MPAGPVLFSRTFVVPFTSVCTDSQTRTILLVAQRRPSPKGIVAYAPPWKKTPNSPGIAGAAVSGRSFAATLTLPLADMPNDDLDSDLWCDFAKRTENWRRIWTWNGITDTAFLFKPVPEAAREAA
jgi:hypothetical protein